MDYFELFEIPVSFSINAAALKLKFFQFSKQFHPDFHTQSSPAEQQQMLEQSTLINQAYNTLANDEKRLNYLLKLKGIIVDEEKMELPKSFLMEMMDLNEALMEAEMEQSQPLILKCKNELEAQETELNNQLYPLLNLINENELELEKATAIKQFYYQRKYLLRIKEKLDTFAAQF